MVQCRCMGGSGNIRLVQAIIIILQEDRLIFWGGGEWIAADMKALYYASYFMLRLRND